MNIKMKDGVLVGEKIIDEGGWTDYKGNPGVRKPTLYRDHAVTTFSTSDLKDKLKGFIDVSKVYVFQGVIINPEMGSLLSNFRRVPKDNNFGYEVKKFYSQRHHKDTQFKVDYNILNVYLSALRVNLKAESVNFLDYPLANALTAPVPGIFTWPTIFVVGKENESFLDLGLDSLTNIKGLTPITDIIYESGMQPLVFDETVKLEVGGNLVQSMTNLLFTYRGKKSTSTGFDADDG